MSKLVIDMMGSDLGSPAAKEGVRLFSAAHPETALVLVGKKEELADLRGYEVIDAPDVLKMDVGVLEVLRKKSSSLVKAVSAVALTGADGVVSAGSTGAFLTAATLINKKIPGVLRPALVTAFPNLEGDGFATVLDVGASNANTAEELAQFGLMGTLYCQEVYGIEKPRVRLLSNGSEDGKGSPLGKAAFPLLKADKRLNFLGNIEASAVLKGQADVIVADGYSGNVMLKSLEGTAKGMSGLLKKAFMRNPLSKLSYLFVRGGLKALKGKMNPKKTGGALLIGVNAVVVKAHGNSDGEAFFHAIELADRLAKAGLVGKIAAGVAHG
ncbi:MAG: phosphate acyltransferase PlsX [Bacilli bacterium]|jgi:glycerol-3-phosphate acyltransferase PlsX|nr:phosphate acyltransferase PlsX [Bacilli bacterium]